MALIDVPTGKTLLALCTKAGNSPYNKGGTIALLESDKIVDRYKYKGGDLVILRPVIDKLIFEYNFKDCGSDKRKIQETVLKNASKTLKKASGVFKIATDKNVGQERLYYLNKTHKRIYVLIHAPTGSKIIIQLEPRKQTSKFLRCELNPSRLRANGMAFFKDFMKLLMANSQKDITFETIAKTPMGVKRIDIAVDMLGVDASDLEGRYVFKNKKLKKEPIQNTTGRVESMYFQMPENDKNQAYWYNKKIQIKETAKDPLEGGQKSPYGHALHTRFEYRINETDKPIANLKSLLNHLTKVHFQAADYTKIKGKDFTHPLFLRYALLRTRDKALEMIPDDLKDKYAASYGAAIMDIWQPEQIWEKGWHAELISLGLLDPQGLKKTPKKKKQTP